VLFSTAAMAQQVDIGSKDFLSGAGDARLADIARQAAASGEKLVVTAPAYWQDKVAVKLHAGAANASVQMREGFFENVVVKIVENRPEAKAEAGKPTSADVATGKPTAEKAVAEKAATAKAAAAKAAAEKAVAEKLAAEQAAAEQAAAQKAAVERAAAEKATAEKAAAEAAAAAKVAVEKAAAEKAVASKLAVARQRMQKSLNDGHAVDGSLTVEQLQKNDRLFVDGTVRGVVRRSGARSQLYWLEGDLNPDRVELLPNGESRYKVNEPIGNVANPTLRAREADRHFIANVPPPESAERKSLQQQYAEGYEISTTVHPADLRQGDIVYTGNGAAVVARRFGFRYWLDGDLNLGQTGISKQGGNAYRVSTDAIN